MSTTRLTASCQILRSLYEAGMLLPSLLPSLRTNDQRLTTTAAVRRVYTAFGDSCQHQLSPTLLLQFHGVVQGDNGALHLVVGGRLRRDALQPQSRLRERLE